MEGWIKIHRQIKEHWIWKSGRRLIWWLDVLLTVNHADSKVLVRGSIIECKRGQSVRSLETWAKDWNVTKGSVRDFFKLLESDKMITIETTLNSTRITVCNYDDYQLSLNNNKTKNKRSVNGEETVTLPKQEGEEGIKNEKNEEKESAFKSEVWQFTDKYPEPLLKAFLNYWTEKDAKGKMRFQSEKYFEVSRRLATWASRDKTFTKKPSELSQAELDAEHHRLYPIIDDNTR